MNFRIILNLFDIFTTKNAVQIDIIMLITTLTHPLHAISKCSNEPTAKIIHGWHKYITVLMFLAFLFASI